MCGPHLCIQPISRFTMENQALYPAKLGSVCLLRPKILLRFDLVRQPTKQKPKSSTILECCVIDLIQHQHIIVSEASAFFVLLFLLLVFGLFISIYYYFCFCSLKFQLKWVSRKEPLLTNLLSVNMPVAPVLFSETTRTRW